MNVISFSQARSSLKAVLDGVIDDADCTIITRRDAEDAVDRLIAAEGRHGRVAEDRPGHTGGRAEAKDEHTPEQRQQTQDEKGNAQ